MRLRPPSPSIAPGTVVGGYTVERKLGAGGYGTVYLAREPEGGLFALKFLALEEVERWGEREVSILLRLQHLAHPNVVRLFSHTLWPVAAPEYIVIVMEYVRGASLDTWAREVNPSARAVAQVVLDVARALAAVHGEGVVHRDVKGSNVLVRAEDGRAVLADFGVGCYPGAPGLTRHPFLPGTPEYRAPEAWQHRRDGAGVKYVSGPADDLWALGVTLYWLLRDRHPFEAPDDAAMVEAILSRTPPAPQEANPRVPEVLGQVCTRMLEKRPEARYPDATALGAALAEALAGADAAWDVPLCDFYSEHTATTKGRSANLLAWAKAPHQPPRRGPRPRRVAEGALEDGAVGVDGAALPDEAPAAAPVPAEAEGAPPEGLAPADAAPPAALAPAAGVASVAATPAGATGPRVRGHTAWGGLLWVMGLGLAVIAVGVGWGTRGWAPTPPAQPASGVAAPAVQEMALPYLAPDAGHAAVPPSAGAIPAVAAVRAVPPENGAPVKKTQPLAPASPTRWAQDAGMAGLCLTLACSSGPQVRPAPEPADCPEKSLTSMEDLGIKLDDELAAQFVGGGGGGTYLDVRQGNWKVRMVEGYSDRFRGGTVLSCYLTMGDRVYGRCPTARTKDGTTHPVCFELINTNGDLGMPREDDSTGDTARVHSTLLVRPVSRYE